MTDRPWTNLLLAALLFGCGRIGYDVMPVGEGADADSPRPALDASTDAIDGASCPAGFTDCDGDFFDQFNAVAYDGSDGSLDWSSKPWQESNDDGNPVFMATRAIGVRAGELWVRRGSGGSKYIYREVGLSAATTAELSFDQRTTNNLESNDELWVEVSDNGGTNWSRLDVLRDDSSGRRTYDITAHIATDTQIRFFPKVNLVSGEYYIFDNVRVNVGR